MHSAEAGDFLGKAQALLEIHSLPHGKYRVTQEPLRAPVVYLDHWAVREFADKIPIQDRFISAIKKARATWLFSTANIFEFCAMEDLGQAEAAEKLMHRAIPNLHLADTIADAGFLLEDGAPPHPATYQKDWMLDDLACRAEITRGQWNTRRFLQDAIHNACILRPLFEDLKKSVAENVLAAASNPLAQVAAKKYSPKAGMTLREAMWKEMLREQHIVENPAFNSNDAMDLIHALPASLVADFVLLDGNWSHKVNSAARRLRRAGVMGRIACCYPKSRLHEFLVALGG